MVSKFSLTAAAVIIFASLSDAHMKLNTPYPYGPATLNNSPLNGDGSDFPCKTRSGGYDPPSQPNNFVIGATQQLSFIGSAVHGGGSCQISLTTDMQPTKSSKWQVIHSIEGGCPANTAGNLPDDSNGHGASTFDYSIPEGIEPGQYVLAWTWFNRIGNREMYMNCAPITVTAAKTKRDVGKKENRDLSLYKRDSFPSMFVANINGCITKEGIDIRFPDPGNSIQYAGNPQNLEPLGQPACTGGPGPGPSGSDSSGSAPMPSATVSQSSQTTMGYTAPNGFTTTTSAASIAPTTSAASSPTASTTSPYNLPSPSGPAPSELGSKYYSSGGSSTSNSGGLSGSCSSEGEWNCIGGTSFQRCASGSWSAAEQMAPGVTCTVGISANLEFTSNTAPQLSALHFRRHINLPSHD